MPSPASIQHLVGERDLEPRDGGQDGLIRAAVEAVALGGALSVAFYVLTIFAFLT
jgi:hypothetical protein